MVRRNSSSFLSSLTIIALWVCISIYAGITASLPYMGLKGVSSLLCFSE
ncbi:hypothetical protein Tco_0961176, partial [Tanacetum coccineum]